jgi:hypothetical protein
VPLDITKVKEFLAGLGTSAGNAQTAADNAPAIGSYLLNYIMGSSPTSPDGFDGLVAALMSKWSGDAAETFRKQTQTVRSFGIGVAALADKMVDTQPTGQQLPALMQYELGSRADYTGAASTVYQLFTDAYHKYATATRSQNDFDHWTGYLTGLIRNTAFDISDGLGDLWSTDTTKTLKVPTFEEFVNGTQGSGSGVLTVEFSNSNTFDPGKSQVSYQNPENGAAFHLTVLWNAWGWQNSQVDNANQDSIRNQTRDVEYDGYLQKVMTDLGRQYPTVQAPAQQDNSVLPKTNGTSPYGPPASAYNGGGYNGGGYNGSGFGAGGGALGGKVPGLGSGVPANGTAVPGSAGYSQPAGIPASATGAGVPGPLAGGGLDPTRLAGFNPGGGLAPGATGLGVPGAGGVPGLGGDMTGLGGASGLSPGGGLAGGADAAGLSGAGPGAAGRMMPMAPMAGAGAGQAKGERPRTAFLTEDEEIWGAGGGGDPVL